MAIKVLKNPLSFIGIGIFAILCLIMLIGGSSSDSSFVVKTFFTYPFPDGTDYVITSMFGERIDPMDETKISFHDAVDISAPSGTEIVSPADGYVISYVVTETSGESVTIEHNFGGIIYRTTYAHMLEGSVVVADGQQIKAKEKIGIIGTSGTQSTGIHLHFSLQEFDISSREFKYIDPISILEK